MGRQQGHARLLATRIINPDNKKYVRSVFDNRRIAVRWKRPTAVENPVFYYDTVIAAI